MEVGAPVDKQRDGPNKLLNGPCRIVSQNEIRRTKDSM